MRDVVTYMCLSNCFDANNVLQLPRLPVFSASPSRKKKPRKQIIIT